jgi:hypothetical protein
MVRWVKKLFWKLYWKVLWKDVLSAKGTDDGISPEELVQNIRDRAARFTGVGMVIILQEYYSIKMYVVDGVYKCTWGYNKEVFSIDKIAEPYLQKPVTVMKLKSGCEAALVPCLRDAFDKNEMSVGQLWRLDPTAWDYEAMKLMHQYDFGIRISFKK